MIVDTGAVRFVVPDQFRDRTAYAYAGKQGKLAIGYPPDLGKPAVALLDERRQEIEQATRALLGTQVVILGAVDMIVLAGRPGARLRSTAQSATHFVHHSIATAPARPGQRLELRWSVDSDYPAGAHPDQSAAKVLDHVLASIVPVPQRPLPTRGWAAQSCGEIALVVPASYSRPTRFEFEGAHGERLVIATAGRMAGWAGYFEPALDRLRVQRDAVQTIDGIDERTLVVERHRDEQRLTDAVLAPECNDVHALREARIALRGGASVAIFGGAPATSPASIEPWWRVVVGSFASPGGRP